MGRHMTRREFGYAGIAALLSPALGAMPLQGRDGKGYRACVIGHTGRGHYGGHGLDLAFQKISGVETVAVADPDPEGRAAASKRIGVPRAYGDWREMLRREKPDLVTVAPRWVEHRLEMFQAAAELGAHVYTEKPMATSLEEADAIMRVVEERGIKTAVAHHARLAPTVVHLKRLLDEGLIGQVLEIRTRGKEDRRAGGEDLMVLGTHCLYLMRYLAGEPEWCFARVTEGGRDITREDGRPATEPMGLVAGDTVHATYAFPGGVQGYFASQKNDRSEGRRPRRFQLEVYGSTGTVRFLIGDDPAIHYLPDPLWSPGDTGSKWEDLPDAPTNADPSGLTGFAAANKRIVEDLIQAAETGGQSAVSGYEGRATLEMIMAVYVSHLQGRRVTFPLEERTHPLAG